MPFRAEVQTMHAGMFLSIYSTIRVCTVIQFKVVVLKFITSYNIHCVMQREPMVCRLKIPVTNALHIQYYNDKRHFKLQAHNYYSICSNLMMYLCELIKL